MRPSTEELINKALGRNNLSRTEQKELGYTLRDKIKQCAYQANIVRELRDEIIRLKISNNVLP